MSAASFMVRIWIFYVVGEDTVYVVRVIHGAMDYNAILFSEQKGSA